MCLQLSLCVCFQRLCTVFPVQDTNHIFQLSYLMFFISGNHAPCYVLQDFIKISDPNKIYSYFKKSVIAKSSLSLLFLFPRWVQMGL